MSKLPDGYRVQDGCWNCKHCDTMIYPVRGAPMCLHPDRPQDVETSMEYIVKPAGICPQHERREQK